MRFGESDTRVTPRSGRRLLRYSKRCLTPSWGDGRHYSLAPDYGVSEWTLTGTMPDGRRLEVNGCDFLTVRDGKILTKDSYRKQRPPVDLAR